MKNKKIITCVITHNRLDYTKKCLQSYINTTNRDEVFLVVVDNASSDGTQDWLQGIDAIDMLILNEQNIFPGGAVNQGWNLALEVCNTKLLHRSDNDGEYQHGWLESVEKVFEWDGLGQFGLLTFDENGGNGMEYNPTTHPLYEDLLINWHYGANIGGLCVVNKIVWDQGVRYQEKEWQPGANEDFWFSNEIRNKGFTLAATCDPIVINLSKDQLEKYPEYTAETNAKRNIGWHWYKDENGEWKW